MLEQGFSGNPLQGRPEFRAAAFPQLLIADMVKGEMASESCEKKLDSISHSKTETDRHSRLRRQHALFLLVSFPTLLCSSNRECGARWPSSCWGAAAGGPG